MLTRGCGGGVSPSAPPATAIGVTVSPSAVSLYIGETQPFTATVTGTTNTAAKWSVNNMAGGKAAYGTIASGGLYQAPNAVPSPRSVTVTVTSQAVLIVPES